MVRNAVGPETLHDKLQNKLRGIGTFMQREGFTFKERTIIAHAVYRLLEGKEFAAIDRGAVFSQFFDKSELAEAQSQLQSGSP